MKQLAELLPIILFFTVYKMDGEQISALGYNYTFDGIYSATAVLMIATVAQVVLTRLITGHLEKRLIWLMLAVVGFGTATLVFRNQLFIQWKPTIFNWALAAVFIATRIWTGQTAMQKALGSQLNLPEVAWRRLDTLWVMNFIIVGGLNLFVAYQFSEATWVDYKLYSSIGFTVLLSVLTVVLIMPWIRTDESETESA